MRLLKEHADAVTAVAFSPDGGRLVSAGTDGMILLRDSLDLSVTGRLHPDPRGQGPRPVSAVAATPDGRHIVAAYRPSARRNALWSLGRWGVSGRHPFRALASGLGPEPAVVVSHDGKKLHVAHNSQAGPWGDVEVLQWALPDWRKGQTQAAWAGTSPRAGRWPTLLAVNGPVILTGMTASPGVSLLRTDLRGLGEMWDAHPTAVRGLAILPGRDRVLTSGPSEVRLWRCGQSRVMDDWFSYFVEGPEPIGEWRREGPAYIACLALSPDGATAAVGRNGGVVNLLDVASLSVRATFRWPVGNVTALAFAPDGLRLAAGGESGAVVWDLE